MDIALVGQAATGEGFVRLVPELRPDVVLMDLHSAFALRVRCRLCVVETGLSGNTGN